jgi:hypothetical protein
MQRNILKLKPSAPVLPTAKRVAAYARVSSGKGAIVDRYALSLVIALNESTIANMRDRSGIFSPLRP